MKKILLLFALCSMLFGLSTNAGAQEIRASPFEGGWVWDGQGEEPPLTELIVIGNVMFFTASMEYVYVGSRFTYTAATIEMLWDEDFVWNYRFSGNTLTLIDIDDDATTYTRARSVRSPLEGIWKITGGQDFNPNEDELMVFTRDIMALSENNIYLGFKVDFSGTTISPSLDFLQEEDISEEDLHKTRMHYTLSGTTLTIAHLADDVLIVLTRIYGN